MTNRDSIPLAQEIGGSARLQGRRMGPYHKVFLETSSLQILLAIASKVSCFLPGLKLS
jgi:hypothetical protein